MASLNVTTSQVLGRSRGALASAEHGLIDMTESRDAVRQFSGIKTTVTSGRQVTFILQKLRSIEPDFESWWKPIADHMASDPLMCYFENLRNTIEKEDCQRTFGPSFLFVTRKK